ncbi:Hypothetical protein FKW44_010056, partial [Caligus rogercresseyi]
MPPNLKEDVNSILNFYMELLELPDDWRKIFGVPRQGFAMGKNLRPSYRFPPIAS